MQHETKRRGYSFEPAIQMQCCLQIQLDCAKVTSHVSVNILTDSARTVATFGVRHKSEIMINMLNDIRKHSILFSEIVFFDKARDFLNQFNLFCDDRRIET